MDKYSITYFFREAPLFVNFACNSFFSSRDLFRYLRCLPDEVIANL